MILTTIRDWQIRFLKSYKPLISDALVAEWRSYAIDTLTLPLAVPLTLEKCKKGVRDLFLKSDMEESDTSMMDER